MDPFQFYPTYAQLAARAWKKFESRNFVRVLEPSAGNGDLACAKPYYDRNRKNYASETRVDCCELDMSRHDILRALGFTVVGVDFMALGHSPIYSHCIMNPPFAEGAKHVLKAWDIMWDGEIVAILNAETIRNPYTKERQMLVSLIEQYGDVEFIGKAFLEPEAERKADVEVALVHLRKNAQDGADIIGDLFAQLRTDTRREEELARGHQEFQQIAIPASTIENMVLAFDAAVLAVTESIRAQARAQYYMNLLGDTMETRSAGGGKPADQIRATVASVQSRLHEEYENIKNRAWAGLLRSSNVTSRLSSKAQKRVEAQFEQIKKLEFTVSNIYGFLSGIIASQGKIQIEMACDVFDAITCYYSDNTVFYRGWKSNDRHRTCGLRVKGTRFVLPRHDTSFNAISLSSDSQALLADFDKVFAMLDGKATPEFGLVQAFEKHFNDLRAGARVASSYFDVRYYPKIGTIHFFPRDAALMDRLNRLVGRQRAWLPPETTRVSDNFWVQYDQAEKFDRELRAAVQATEEIGPTGRGALHFSTSPDESLRAQYCEVLDTALAQVQEKHGISTEYRIEAAQESFLLTA